MIIYGKQIVTDISFTRRWCKCYFLVILLEYNRGENNSSWSKHKSYYASRRAALQHEAYSGFGDLIALVSNTVFKYRFDFFFKFWRGEICGIRLYKYIYIFYIGQIDPPTCPQIIMVKTLWQTKIIQ